MPEDNAKEIDNIKVNREEYIAKGKIEAEVQFETNKENFKLNPSHIKGLEIISKYIDLDVLDIIKRT